MLLGCPNRLADVTRDFAVQLGLGAKAQRVYEHHLERVGHRPVSTFSAAELLRRAGARALIVHGRDDCEVPFANAQAIADASPTARLLPFEGLGHRTILYAPPVFRAVMAEFARPQSEKGWTTPKSAYSSAGQEMKASA